MRVGQLNMRRSPMVGDLLVKFLQEQQYDVLLIQDPPRQWLIKKPAKRFSIVSAC